METVGKPFSTRDNVSDEQLALSATCAMLKFRLKRASFICSPTTDIFCSNFRGNLVPIVFFAITTYHIICKCSKNLYYMMCCACFSKKILEITLDEISPLFCYLKKCYIII